MEIETQNSKLETLANVQAVLAYLLDAGWQVSQSGLYKHRKAGKITSEPDGTFPRKDVDKYAKAFLKQKATGKKKQDAQDELQRQKLEKELEKLEIDNTRARLKRDVELEKYIPRDEMYLEMASRAGIFHAGLDYWIRTTGAEWVRSVGGDLQKVGALIDAMIREKDILINQYASIRDFQVIIDGVDDDYDDDDDEDEEPE